MELKPGYKQTEVGAIPEDWRVVKIKDVASIQTGKRNTQDRVHDGTYPFFVRSEIVECINSYSFEGEAVLTAGDGVGTGKIFHYTKGKFDFHQRVYRISDYSPELNGFFFFLYFSNHFYDRIMSMTAKSSVDSVRLEMIADMVLPLPPLLEQRAIAAALGDFDALLDALGRLIAKKRSVKRATMDQLLTGQTRLTGFSEVWEVRRLGEIGSFSKGRGIRKNEVVADGFPCIRYGEIYTHHFDHIRAFTSFIPAGVAKQSQRLRKGDLLFAGSGETAEEIGKCVAFLDDAEAYAGSDIIILSPIGQNSMYLGYLMNHASIAEQKARMGQGDAVVHISVRNLAQLQMHLPQEAEQTAIATVLSDMDAEIEVLELKLAKTRALKQGVMQELLTGRIRLVSTSG